MKYYAVTDDPNELLHYGVKGMKWGQHLFGDDLRPKSAGYKRALGKLKGFAKKAKSSVQKSATQHAMNKQKKQEDKFNKAVQKSQQRINMIENMRNVDRITSYENRVDRAYKNEQKAAKAAAKQDRKYARNERKMEKYTQLARENRLRYGKLSEDQINRIHDRLALENNTRALGGREKPRFRTRMKDALQEGILQGVVQGTAAGMKEVAVAKIQNRLGNKRALDRQSSNEAKRQKESSRIKNKKTTRELKQDFKQEVREQEIREGVGVMDRFNTFKGASRNLQKIESDRKERKRLEDVEARIRNEMDLEYNPDYQKMLANRQERKRIQDVQDRLNSDTDRDWANHLSKTGMDDVSARIAAGYNADQVGKASKEKAQEQRRRALALEANKDKVKEEAEKAAAFKAFTEQQKALEDHQNEVARLENENKKLKADYDDAIKKYNQEIEQDKKTKEKYDADMAEYNRAVAQHNRDMNKYNEDYRVYVRTAQYDSLAQEPKKPVLKAKKPNKPNYINPTPPQKPNYHKIDYSEPKLPMPSSYDEYMRLKALQNGGGKGKGKGK